MNNIGGSRGARDASPTPSPTPHPPCPIFLIFMQFLVKFVPNNRFALSPRIGVPVWEILDPLLDNVVVVSVEL